MSDRYLLILVLYTLACFGTVLALTQGLLWLLREPLLRAIARLSAKDGVVAHVILNALPAIVAFLLTSFSAVPGYFNGEPIGTHELPGAALIALAALGAYFVLAPLGATCAMIYRTRVRTDGWQGSARNVDSFADVPVVEVGSERAFVAAAGLLNKRIFLSSPVRSLLSTRELRAVLRHEVAHCDQRHNFARLLVAASPRLFSCTAFEDSFRETIEYAADDAVLDVPGDALNLASAVVTLARRTVPASGMLYSGIVEPTNAVLLKRRVDRMVLLQPRSTGKKLRQITIGCTALLAATTLIGSLPLAQEAFRETLELLVR